MLKILENILLKDYTTFHIGGPARYFVSVKDTKELKEAIRFAKQKNIKFMILGGGSNILVSDQGFDGLAIKNEIKKKEITTDGLAVFGSGENWDEAVSFAVSQGLGGLENLSGIPGTVGATPVQNVGAYGTEVKDTISYVNTLDSETLEEKTFTNAECQFGYRTSIFKKPEYKKYFITEVAFALKKDAPLNLEYKDVKNYFTAHSELTPNLQTVRSAVLEIRSGKFPNVKDFGLAGSFFKNPIVTVEKYQELLKNYPNVPNFPAGEGLVKVPLAWILDNVCQLKGYKTGNVGLYEKQPIVLTNYGGASCWEVQALSNYVKAQVKAKTGIEVEEEVEIW